MWISNKFFFCFYLSPWFVYGMQMTRYKQADFADEDASSIGSRSIHLNETTTIPSMHIRYHTTHVSFIRFDFYF